MTVDHQESAAVLKAMMIPDLRTALRARGLSPAGSIETLRERLREWMVENGTASLELTSAADVEQTTAGTDGAEGGSKEAPAGDMGVLKNNYVRPEGQNVGNFITDRPSSRVLAPPGGSSSISLG